MKRFGIALLLVTGALLLILGSASTASALPMPPPPPEDYCGTNEVEVPDYGPSFNFTEACKAHDECYAAGGGPFARARCDNQFLRDMNSSCTAMWNRGDPELLRCKTVALTYYAAVRLGGWLYFYSPVTPV